VTINYRGANATELGYLLHKHPDKIQDFEMSFGRAHVFYPEASGESCTAALLLDVDALELLRNPHYRGSGGRSLDDYVNDRPYTSSSMMAVALGKVFRTAMTGRCDARPRLAMAHLPLTIVVSALPSTGGLALARALFEPLGWTVAGENIPLDPEFPTWGASNYLRLELSGSMILAEALRQLYVLLPVLDDAKHYWVGNDEVAKLLRAGAGWLPGHPERDLITRRYLAHQKPYITDAAELLAGGAGRELDAKDATAVPPSQTLAANRAEAVLATLRRIGAGTVVDVGCGEGALLKRLLAVPAFTRILGADVSGTALAKAEKRLQLDELSDRQRGRIKLIQSSVTYLDDRLEGFDAVVLMEVIEHLELQRLPALVSSVFAHAAPESVIVTTPNADYNPLYPSLARGTFRHPDHRFEWGRESFQAWAAEVCGSHAYTVSIEGIGPADETVGAPTQMAVFRKVHA